MPQPILINVDPLVTDLNDAMDDCEGGTLVLHPGTHEPTQPPDKKAKKKPFAAKFCSKCGSTDIFWWLPRVLCRKIPQKTMTKCYSLTY